MIISFQQKKNPKSNKSIEMGENVLIIKDARDGLLERPEMQVINLFFILFNV